MYADVSAPARPPFYRSPTLLRFPDHRLVGLRDGTDFAFARAAAAIPLVAGEFAHAQRSYPIVFSAETRSSPLAVTAFAAGENVFVREDGGWTEGDYVPGYVRR